MPKVTRPNITLFTPVKLVPVIVTNIPTEPLVGLKPVIVGVTVKLPELVAVPPDVVMMMLPVFVLLGTLSFCVSEFAAKLAATPE